MTSLYYANKLIGYFQKQLIDNSDFLPIMSDNEIENISIFQFIGILMQKFQKFNPMGIIYRDLINDLFSKYLSGDLDLFVIPEGFSLDKEEDFEWLYQALLYHYMESIKSYLGLVIIAFSDKITHKGITQLPLILSPIIEKFVQFQPPETQEFLKSIKEILPIEKIEEDFIELLSQLIASYSDENLIQEYVRDFDLLLSFFIRPIGKEYPRQRTAETIKNLRTSLDERFEPLFTPLDTTLRNKLVHRNYFLDTKTDTIIYYVYKGNRKEYRYKGIADLRQDVMQLKFIRMNFFLVALINLFSKTGELTRPFSKVMALWNPIDKNSLIRDFFGTDVSVNIILQLCDPIEESLIKLRQLMNFKQGVLLTAGIEERIEDIHRSFWEEVFSHEELVGHHELIYGYFLFALAEHPNPKQFEFVIDIYSNCLKKSKQVIRKHDLIFETSWALIGSSIDYERIRQMEIDLEKEKISSVLKVILKYHYSAIIRNTAIQGAYKGIAKESNAINILLKVVKESDTPLTGGQISQKIRKELDKYWPQPDFQKPETCIRLAGKLGLILVEEKGDLLIKKI
jgi:hypothetical protein